MGPFETIELNAPGGIADYVARFGPSFLAPVAAEPRAPRSTTRTAWHASWPMGPGAGAGAHRGTQRLARRAAGRAGGTQEGADAMKGKVIITCA
jgi:hypothetical protein